MPTRYTVENSDLDCKKQYLAAVNRYTVNFCEVEAAHVYFKIPVQKKNQKLGGMKHGHLHLPKQTLNR